jgi:hypothetical protein
MKNALKLGLALAMATALPFTAEAKRHDNDGKGQKTILACSAASDTIDISMNAHYVTRTKNKQVLKRFKAEFEAAPDNGYTGGQVMTVLVNDVVVGSRKLKQKSGGDIEGELRLENGQIRHGRFPINFPVVVADSTVAIQFNGATVLSCALK